MANRLSEEQINELVRAMPSLTDVWYGIALTKLGINQDEIEDLVLNVCKELIRRWAQRLENQQGQVQKLADLLYEMDGNRHVRVDEVERILGVPRNRSVPDAGVGASPGGPDNISAQPQAPSGAIQLTTQMERSLALCVVSEEDLRDLGTFGFGVRERIIDAALYNNRSINAAATEVIKRWALDQEPDKAYGNLCTILRQIGRNAWIDELED